MKYLLPFMLLCFWGVAQDGSKIAPNTGLPFKAEIKNPEEFDKLILKTMSGISTKSILVAVSRGGGGALPAEVKTMLENQKRLFLKRNRFTNTNHDLDSFLAVAINVTHLTLGASDRTIGYMYQVDIGRHAYVGKPKNVRTLLMHNIQSGIASNSDSLKTEIGNLLDKIALHIFEATE